MGRIAGTVARLCAVAVARAAAICAGVAAVTALGFGAQDVLLVAAPARAAAALRITGDVGGVVPGGASVPLTLTLRNTGDAPASVTRVTTRSTGSTGRPACAARYLTVGSWAGALTIPAGGAARVTVPVRLAAETPDACASGSWGLAYTAQ